MQKVELKSLALRNFKGIKSIDLDFSNKSQINGRNGSGKTTIADAYTWLLYGKNSNNDTDFNIKTLDANNSPIHNLKHEVVGVLAIDGKDTELRRVYSEKWTTKRGNPEPELTGHETAYYINEVPKSKAEYDLFINSILPDSLARIISVAGYFNNKIKKDERRAMLAAMAGGISSEDILQEANNAGLDTNAIRDIIALNESLFDVKKRNGAKKSKLKEELDKIPERLDELDRATPAAHNWEQIEKDINQVKQELIKANESINSDQLDISRQKEQQAALRAESYRIEEQISCKRLELAQNNTTSKNIIDSITEARINLSAALTEQQQALRELSGLELELPKLKAEKDELFNEWQQVNSASFNSISTCCPTCNREYDNAQAMLIEAEANYNTSKALKLSEIKAKGQAKAVDITTLEAKIAALIDQLNKAAQIVDNYTQTLEGLERDLQANKAPEDSNEIKELIAQRDAIVIPEIVYNTNEQKQQLKRSLELQIDELKSKLNIRAIIENNQARKSELETIRKDLSQQIVDLEKIDYSIDLYYRLESEIIESRVNSKFGLVKFKLFEQQLNGGLKEICDCILNGVPYSDLNTAGKVNADLDIIQTLQKDNAINCPVFIDNRESVTTILVDTEYQSIYLKVDPTAQGLEVINID